MVICVGVVLVLLAGLVRAEGGSTAGSVLAAEPAASPWEKLSPMPAAAGRFVLAADERKITRLRVERIHEAAEEED